MQRYGSVNRWQKYTWSDVFHKKFYLQEKQVYSFSGLSENTRNTLVCRTDEWRDRRPNGPSDKAIDIFMPRDQN